MTVVQGFRGLEVQDGVGRAKRPYLDEVGFCLGFGVDFRGGGLRSGGAGQKRRPQTDVSTIHIWNSRHWVCLLASDFFSYSMHFLFNTLQNPEANLSLQTHVWFGSPYFHHVSLQFRAFLGLGIPE